MAHSVVIGGAGFVGSWVVDEILKDPNNRVTIIDNLISSEKWNISTDPRVRFIEGSAAESATFDKINEPVDFLYQLACFHGNQSSIARPIDDLENGLKTTLVSLEWVKNNSPRTRVIYSGAGCAVAEKTWENPHAVREIDETSLHHDSPYSISKITGEMYCLFYANKHNLDIIRMRFQNIYGPREILGAGIWRGTENTVWRNVIPTLIYRALKNQPIEIYGTNASRDFTYVDDVARIIVQAAHKAKTNSIFNIASGKESFIHDLAMLILNLTQSSSEILLKEKRNWDTSGRRFGDKSKLAQELGLGTKIEIQDGLTQTIKWTRDNLARIEMSIRKHSI